MSRKKTRKAARKVTAAPPPKVEDDGAVTAIPGNQSIESDVPAVARRSIETDNENLAGDVERNDE